MDTCFAWAYHGIYTGLIKRPVIQFIAIIPTGFAIWVVVKTMVLFGSLE